MRTHRARLTAIGAVVLALLGAWSWLPADAVVVARNTFGAQCSYDSPSGQVRLWWTENRTRNVLSGDDGGVASDGDCSTVPTSVPWMADQIEAVMRAYKAVGLPMTQSDKGIQRLFNGVLDDGSGAFDVFLDGYADGFAQGRAECSRVTYYQGRSRRFKAVGKLYVFDVPAAVPDAERAQTVRQVLAHELVHTAQCAVTNARRATSGGALHGPWIEAVPQAFSASLVGGQWDIGLCDKTTKLLSPSDGEDPGYGQWPFWYSLLGAPSTSSYLGTLRDVIRVPVSKSGPQLARVIHQRFTDARINRALLAWVTDSYFGGTHPSASGVPITWDTRSLNDSMTFPGYESTAPNQLSPPAAGSAQTAVTIAPMTCAALLVPWPDGAQTLSVGASGAAGGNLAGIMTAGLDIAPGSPATGPCGADGQRTVIPLAGNQFTATRPCSAENGVPQMWVLMVNGGIAPLHLQVTATAS